MPQAFAIGIPTVRYNVLIVWHAFNSNDRGVLQILLPPVVARSSGRSRRENPARTDPSVDRFATRTSTSRTLDGVNPAGSARPRQNITDERPLRQCDIDVRITR